MKKTTTAKMILDKRYLKVNAEHPVKLRIIHDREPRYYPTEYSFSDLAWTQMHGKKPGELQDSLDELLKKEQQARELIKGMKVFTFDLFKKRYTKNYDTATVAGAFQSHIDDIKTKQPGTASNHECAMKSLEKFKAGTLLIDVTKDFLNDYSEYMEDKSPTTVSMYTRALRTIIRDAIETGEFPVTQYPFGEGKFQPPQARGNKRSLPPEHLLKVDQYKGEFEKAKDFFMFSYFCNGANMKDIARLRHCDVDDDYIYFKRAKTVRTKKRIEDIKIELVTDLKRIIKRYGTGGQADDYIFDILQKGITPIDERKKVQLFTHLVNNHLKKIAKHLRIKPFTSYAARHSWAVIQEEQGLSLTAISKGLGHSTTKVTQDYLESLNTKTIKMAARNATAFRKPTKVVSL